MIYLDASAVVKLLVPEAESAALRSHLSSETVAPMFTSQLTVTEVKRALHAHGDDDEAVSAGSVAVVPGRLDLPDRAILARPVTAEIFAAAGDLAPGTALRSLDAIHLAVAMTAGEALTAVLTYDRRMAEAAAGLGIAVLAPV